MYEIQVGLNGVSIMSPELMEEGTAFVKKEDIKALIKELHACDTFFDSRK